MYRFMSLIRLIFHKHSVCFETGLKSFKGYFRPFTNIQFFLAKILVQASIRYYLKF